ncbi:SRPBCC family protein [Marinobacteraceae bacterium S3BR75-40.1]
MAITIAIEINREFEVAADFDTTFDLLADVPGSASHFPKLDKLTPLGDNAYRWEMEKVGIDKHSIQSVYACKYFADKDAGRITWEPIKGEGNGVVSGSWTISSSDKGSHLKFFTQAELTLKLPSLLKLAISPVVKHEFNSLVDTYVKNLQQELGEPA